MHDAQPNSEPYEAASLRPARDVGANPQIGETSDRLFLSDPFEDPLTARKVLERALSAGVELRPGDHIRLRPKHRADIFDIALKGKAATIAAIEQDFEGRVHVAVTVDDDPGADLGLVGKPGHRFYFDLDEIEIIETPRSAS